MQASDIKRHRLASAAAGLIALASASLALAAPPAPPPLPIGSDKVAAGPGESPEVRARSAKGHSGKLSNKNRGKPATTSLPAVDD
jgi:hypothetical protein